MANTTLRQAKLRKLAIAPEATSGTYVPLNANTLIVPVIGSPAPLQDRGTQMIVRTSTQDAQAGDLVSIRGSSGWTLTSEMEIHDVAEKYNYWVLALLSCGFQGAEVANEPETGDTTYRLTPTTKAFANFSSGTTNSPCTTSLSVITNNNQVEDSVQRIRGATGTASFNFTAGEIAKLSCAWKGLVVDQVDPANDFFDLSDTDASALGSTAAWSNPYVVKDITMVLLDDNGDDKSGSCLQSLTINMASNHADFVCAQEKDGLGVSPVFQDGSASFSFTIPSDSTSDSWVWRQLRVGTTFSLSITLKSANGRNLKVSIPKGQLQSYAWADANGIQMLSFECLAVRAPGETSFMTIDYLYSPA